MHILYTCAPFTASRYNKIVCTETVTIQHMFTWDEIHFRAEDQQRKYLCFSKPHLISTLRSELDLECEFCPGPPHKGEFHPYSENPTNQS